jgi:exodeoxyribonuclease V gamma subunit
MLYLVTSNRIEALHDALLERLEARPSRSPLEPRTLAVDSLAQRRTLTMAIAQREGVAINLRFVFLAQWLWRQMAMRVPGIAPDTPFDAATLAWRIDRLLADPGFVQRRPRLAPYLDACDEAMRFAFARRTAQLVEHCTTYRHDWLERWSRGDTLPVPASLAPDSAAHRAWIDDEAWQRALWQALERDLGLPGEHPARRFVKSLDALFESSRESATEDTTLPRALHVFALPAIAPLHQQLLAALARVIDVHVYALQPTRAYWVDVISDKRLAQLRARGSVHALYAQVGHPLLAAWGAQMQAQHALLQQHLGTDVIDTDAFVEVAGPPPGRSQGGPAPSGGSERSERGGSCPSRLARMQRAILHLDDGTNDRAAAPPAIDPDDDSVEIHVAHSLRRELEAIQQRLLALFAQPGAPAPHQVLLATPDIDEAAPMIDAVFGATNINSHIAYTITGRSQGDDGGAAAALLELIDSGRSRWSAESLDTLVHLPLVAQRFDWSDDDLATLRDWIDKAGMRFGLDAAHRRSLDLPDDDAWTLDDAIERLLMGHAFAPAAAVSRSTATATMTMTTAMAPAPTLRAPLAGKLPAMTVGGAHAALLGSLAALQRSLSTWHQRLAHAHAPADWQRHLLWAIDQFFAPAQPAEHAGLHALRLALSAWHARLRAAGETRELSATLMRESLEHELRQRAAGAVPSGSLNFASMTGLRRLPFRVVIVFGLNDGAWGASGAPAEWDLMARAPRLGDRQQRQDQRDVLLDLMLAARERFWISFTGRDQRDNHPLPPAAVVDEWIEALAAADGVSVDALRARIVVEHPLQPFAPELFAPDAPARKRSHHRGYAAALERSIERMRDRAKAADASLTLHRAAGAARGVDETITATTATRATDVAHAAEAAETDLFGPDSTLDPPSDSTFDSTFDATLDTPAEPRAGTPTTAAIEPDEEDLALDGNDDAAALFVRPLPPVPQAQRRITLADLQRFFANPARELLERRLGIALPWGEEALRSDEPFTLDVRDRARLARALMPALRAGADDDALAAHARATGLLPAAAIGSAAIARELDALRQQAQWLAGGSTVRTKPVDLHVPTPAGDWQLVVEMEYLPHDGLSIWRPAKLDAQRRLEAWIEHLALNLVAPAPPGRPKALAAPSAGSERSDFGGHSHDAGRTVLVTRDRRLTLQPLEDADPAALLRDLVRLMAAGLLEPLPFMPNLSWQATQGKAPPPSADDVAASPWTGRDERRDPWVLLAWRGRSLVGDDRFRGVARDVYGLLAQRLDDRIDIEEAL